jgi:hypothetical protein
MGKLSSLSGLILLASMCTGCASPQTTDGAEGRYKKLAEFLVEYEPVGDATIDGLARPFVTGAIKLRADVEKEHKRISASEANKELGRVKAEDFAEAFEKLEPAKRQALAAEAAAAKTADDARVNSLMKQLTDMGMAGVKLGVDIHNATQGNAGGVADLGLKLLSGPGKKAAAQVHAAMRAGGLRVRDRGDRRR